MKTTGQVECKWVVKSMQLRIRDHARRIQPRPTSVKGTYFEELIYTYLRNEATYRDLYEKVRTYSDWAQE